MQKLTFALALVLAAWTPAVEAGVVYEIEVKDHEQSPPKTEETQVASDGKNISMDIAPGEDGSRGKMIFRGDRREMVVVDDDNQTYTVIDKAAVDAISGQVSDAMKQVDEMLKNLPKEQQDAIKRAQASGMGGMPGLGATAPPKREVRITGERDSKNGYPCVKYEELRDERKVRELWVTDWSNIEGGGDVVNAFEDMADFFAELLDSIPNFGQGGGPDAAFTEVFTHGFPVLTREFDPETGAVVSEAGLRSAKRQTIDPDAFEPPSGYKRQEMFRP